MTQYAPQAVDNGPVTTAAKVTSKTKKVKKAKKQPRHAKSANRKRLQEVAEEASSFAVRVALRTAVQRQNADEFPRQPDRVVVGDQVARVREDAQVSVGQEVEGFLGGPQRVMDVASRPEEQDRDVQARIRVEQIAVGARGPVAGEA